MICFNPCFNGRCKRTFRPHKAWFQTNFVSILVLMEDVKEQRTRGKESYSKDVSILVLMEDVKELWVIQHKTIDFLRVSILVLMEDVKERNRVKNVVYKLSKFQSLF